GAQLLEDHEDEDVERDEGVVDVGERPAVGVVVPEGEDHVSPCPRRIAQPRAILRPAARCGPPKGHHTSISSSDGSGTSSCGGRAENCTSRMPSSYRPHIGIISMSM